MKWPDDFIGKVIQGDCLDVMRQMPDKCVDLVVTSPPYNKKGFRGGAESACASSGKYSRWGGGKIEYNSYDDNMEELKYQEWQINILNESRRIIKSGGSVFYNHKIRRFKNKASHPMEWILKSDLNLYQQIIWHRNGSVDQNINYCTPMSEIIFWLTKDTPNVYKDNAGFREEIWRFSFENNIKNHPAPFPLELPENCIQLCTTIDCIVFDPFMGSGSTAVASERLGRSWCGVELDYKYCEIARKRIADEQAQGKLF